MSRELLLKVADQIEVDPQYSGRAWWDVNTHKG